MEGALHGDDVKSITLSMDKKAGEIFCDYQHLSWAASAEPKEILRRWRKRTIERGARPLLERTILVQLPLPTTRERCEP